MSILRKNVIANFIGQAWSVIMAIIFVPVYLHYLGVEAYGLLGLFVSLKLVFEILNVGLGATTNRELARREPFPDKTYESRNILRTLEIIYAAIGIVVALALCFSSNWIATRWVNVEHIPLDTVRLAVVIYGITLALQWRIPLYTGALRGMERQVLLNGLKVVFNTFGNIGSIIVVIIFPTITAFLLWQLISCIVEVNLNSWLAWKVLRSHGPASRPKFDIRILKEIWRFSASMSGISIFAIILKQADKIIISKLLPMEQLGYYNTANSAVGGLDLFVDPFSKATFPRFTNIISKNDTADLAKTYHKVSQMLTSIVAPIAAILIFFSYDILLLWTRSEIIAKESSLSLSILAFAMMMRAVMSVTFALQFAAALTWIPLWNNFLGVVLLVPLMIFLIKYYGILGGAIVWALFYFYSYLIVPPIMHRYILKGHLKVWIFRDTLPFILISLFIFGGIYLIGLHLHNKLITSALVFLGAIVYLCLAVLLSKYVRVFVKDLLDKHYFGFAKNSFKLCKQKT